MAYAMRWFVASAANEWTAASDEAQRMLTCLLVVLQHRGTRTADNDAAACDSRRGIASTLSYADERGGRSYAVARQDGFFSIMQVDDETGEARMLWQRMVDAAGRPVAPGSCTPHLVSL